MAKASAPRVTASRRGVRRLWLTAAVTVVLAAAGAAGLRGLTGQHHGGLPVVGHVIPTPERHTAPPISGITLTGQHLNIASWHNHTVVINFWGSWCVPCRREAPVLRRVSGDTRFLGVRFAGIDIREQPAAGVAFEREYHIPYPSISDPDDLIGAGFGAAAPVATPSTYILDARGRVAWAWFGATSYTQLELAVTEVAQP
jgi:thiol-disulfide isomerase/thioredoxin